MFVNKLILHVIEEPLEFYESEFLCYEFKDVMRINLINTQLIAVAVIICIASSLFTVAYEYILRVLVIDLEEHTEVDHFHILITFDSTSGFARY